MWAVARRTYNSPLREQQARQTRTQILEALIGLVATEGPEAPIRELARRAGVSERTVYRHFPDRAALLDGLSDHVARATGWDDVDGLTVDDFVESIPEVFASFDAHEAETRAIALLNVQPGHPAAITVRNRAFLAEALARELPALDPEERAEVAAVLHLLGSSRTWLRFRYEEGLTPEQAARAARRAARAVLASVAGRHVG
jgi:AcrR family transcriptional regulator